jgi:hypothetical protein
VGAFLPATGEVITMLKSLAAAGLVITLASTAYAKPPEVVRQTKVTDGYSSGYLNWTGGIKGMDYLWKVQTHEGKIHICGAGHYTGVQARLQTKDIMRRAFVTLEGKKILRDLRFFNIVKTSDSLAPGATANCANTGVDAPKKAYQVYLSWDRTTRKF